MALIVGAVAQALLVSLGPRNPEQACFFMFLHASDLVRTSLILR